MDSRFPGHFDSYASPQPLHPSYNSTPDNRPQGISFQSRFGRPLNANMQGFDQQNDGGGVSMPQQFAARPRTNSGTQSFRQRQRGNTFTRPSEMNSSFMQSQTQIPRLGNGSIFQQFGGQPSFRDRHDDNALQRNYNQQAGGFSRNPLYSLQSIDGADPQMMHEQLNLQNRLLSMAQMISRQSGIPGHQVTIWTGELEDLSNQLEELQHMFRNKCRLLQLERDRLSDLLSAQKQLTQNAMAERDRACGERDRLEAKSATMQRRQRELEVRLDEMERKNASTIEHLRKQLRFRDEQLNGKRSLWMETQSQRSIRKNQGSESRDPFATPTTHRNHRTGLALRNRSEERHSTPAPSSSKLMVSPQGAAAKPEPKNEFWPYLNLKGSRSSGPVTIGDGHIAASRALVPFKSEEAISQEFSEYFKAIYALIDKWVEKYAHTVSDDPSADHGLSHNQSLWSFLLGCVYQDLTQAHDHVILLLRNPASRPSFIIRVIIQYLYVFVWKATAFSGFNAGYCEELENIDMQLNVKGLEPAQRAELVSAQTRVIQSIVESDTYTTFRSFALSEHAKALRNTIGPLLDETSRRPQAGKALLNILVRAWDLSAKMYTSNYTFLFKFPECGSRFVCPTMECQNAENGESNHELHLRHAKVKLVIKPIITMRNDRNFTISVKKVHDSHVLIFP